MPTILLVIAAATHAGSHMLAGSRFSTQGGADQSRGVNQFTKMVGPSTGFDFPVGAPDGKGYYNAQGFGVNKHLGDDWNGDGGGNSDLGDPVTSVADGVVFDASHAGEGWGNVVRVLHNAGTDKSPRHVESLYGHLDSMSVSVGDVVERGQLLGTIGTANGRYVAHLHLEIRVTVGLPVGPGYSANAHGYVDPTRFIQRNRHHQR